ncbi:hypothetical protein Pint_28355 [Pistacia integerrima]|uniref:Uncharacterized protein n=1 Tax=Pistacia integerrima TaxID=434235 RepID=A0ACC0YSE6_9ROSI|nr:hypothetical protein Pint_28355 [Pistacia integerrima]
MAIDLEAGGVDSRIIPLTKCHNQTNPHVKYAPKLAIQLPLVGTDSTNTFSLPSTPHPQAHIAQSHIPPTPPPAPTYDQNWYPDIGATNHISSNLDNLSLNTNVYTRSDQIQVGNGQSLKILHTGSSVLYAASKSFFLNKILHAPEIKKNLLSVSQFTKDNNVYFEFHPSFFCVKDPSLGAILLKGPSKNGLYPLHTLTSPSTTPASYIGERVSVPTMACTPGHPRFTHSERNPLKAPSRSHQK